MSSVDPSPRGPAISYFDQITKAAAVLGAIIAAGQAGTSWITGYWTSEAELQKKDKELKLSEVKARSELAESYIKLIIAKDTPKEHQVLLMGALSDLDQHPLQPWAKKQFAEMQRTLDAFNRAQAARSEAFQLKTDAERRQAELLGEIAGLTAERDMAGANTAASNEKQTQIAKKYAELIQVRETLQVATKADTTGIVVSTTSTVEVPAVVTAAVAAIERKVNAAMLTSVFPERARNNIQTDVKYLAAAMKEAQIADARVAAVIIATIAVETPNFEHYEEPQNRFNTKDQPFDLYEKDGPIGKALGNNEPGDGARFRGRGYIGLTGRANYSRMAIRLGVDLVNNPDLAKNPDVASRVVCAYFTDRLARVTDALDRNDLAAIRRVVNGGAHGLDEFVSAYNKVLSKLNG